MTVNLSTSDKNHLTTISDISTYKDCTIVSINQAKGYYEYMHNDGPLMYSEKDLKLAETLKMRITKKLSKKGNFLLVDRCGKKIFTNISTKDEFLLQFSRHTGHNLLFIDKSQIEDTLDKIMPKRTQCQIL